MLSHNQLLSVMTTNHDVYLTFATGQEWARFHTILDKGIITLEVQDFNYTPMYYLPAHLPDGTSVTPLLDSPVYHSLESPVPKYYLHQTNRLIKFLKGLMSPLEMEVTHLFVHTYCRYCKRRLTSYKSMYLGFGPECSSHLGIIGGNR